MQKRLLLAMFLLFASVNGAPLPESNRNPSFAVFYSLFPVDVFKDVDRTPDATVFDELGTRKVILDDSASVISPALAEEMPLTEEVEKGDASLVVELNPPKSMELWEQVPTVQEKDILIKVLKDDSVRAELDNDQQIKPFLEGKVVGAELEVDAKSIAKRQVDPAVLVFL